MSLSAKTTIIYNKLIYNTLLKKNKKTCSKFRCSAKAESQFTPQIDDVTVQNHCIELMSGVHIVWTHFCSFR